MTTAIWLMLIGWLKFFYYRGHIRLPIQVIHTSESQLSRKLYSVCKSFPRNYVYPKNYLKSKFNLVLTCHSVANKHQLSMMKRWQRFARIFPYKSKRHMTWEKYYTFVFPREYTIFSTKPQSRKNFVRVSAFRPCAYFVSNGRANFTKW